MPSPAPAPHFLIQPGWQNSGPAHWQTLWQDRLGGRASRVPQQDWLVPQRDAWVPTLVRAIEAHEPSIVLAHSIGSIATAFAMHDATVGAAVLVAPADPERDGAPEALRSFTPVPMTPLPNAALVIASDNDPYCGLERARAFASAWRADFEVIAGGRHINAEAGFGEWREGWQMIGEWLRHHGLSWPEEGETQHA